MRIRKLTIFISGLLLICNSLSAQKRKKINIDSLKTKLHTVTEDSTRIAIYNRLAWAYIVKDLDTSRAYVDTVLPLIENCVATKKYATNIKAELGLAEVNNTLGSISYYKGDFKTAIDYYLKSLSLYEKYGMKDRVGNMYNNIGSMQHSIHNYTEALKYFELSKKIKEELLEKKPNDPELLYNISTSYNNLGSVYAESKQYDKAIDCYNQALKLKKASGDKRSIAQTTNNIGELYCVTGEYKKAEPFLKEGLKLFEEVKHQEGVASSLNSLGKNYTYLKNLKEALICLKRAETISKENGFKDDLRITYSGLATAYEKNGDYKLSNEYLQKYIILHDSLINTDVTQQSMELATKYETAKKEQENKLLQAKDNLSTETIKRQKVTSYFIFAGLAITLLFAFFIFRGLRAQQKANLVIANQKKEVEHQKELVDEKQKEILDSIHYAKRIQGALFTSENYFKKYVNDFFILNRPKDIVSGDFYWALHHNDNFYLATADCTGHGVPGAFMSLLNISFFNETVIEKKITAPDKILNEMRDDIIKVLNPEGNEDAKDGMDCILCSFNFKNNMLEYAAANNSFYLVRNNKLIIHSADKMPVGMHGEELKPFTLHQVNLEKGDIIYTFTDGYADQFGGAKGKKFKYKKLEELLLSIAPKPMSEQKSILEKTMDDWKQGYEQIDDILIVGIRV